MQHILASSFTADARAAHFLGGSCDSPLPFGLKRLTPRGGLLVCRGAALTIRLLVCCTACACETCTRVRRLINPGIILVMNQPRDLYSDYLRLDRILDAQTPW